jgi:hypothetical protein
MIQRSSTFGTEDRPTVQPQWKASVVYHWTNDTHACDPSRTDPDFRHGVHPDPPPHAPDLPCHPPCAKRRPASHVPPTVARRRRSHGIHHRSGGGELGDWRGGYCGSREGTEDVGGTGEDTGGVGEDTGDVGSPSEAEGNGGRRKGRLGRRVSGGRYPGPGL